MTTAASSKRRVWLVLIVVVIVAGSLSIPAVRNVAVKSLQSLRMQKVQAVNADFSPYVDANANPTLHQMVTQMISDKVQVEVNEEDQPVTDVASARQMAGFDVLLLSARKDAPKLVVGGSHKIDVSRGSRAPASDRHRGGPSGSGFAAVARRRQPSPCRFRDRFNCSMEPAPAPRTPARWSPTISPGRRRPRRSIATAFVCARARLQSSICLPSLDVGGLAQIGLETAGMTPAQASDFLHTVDWKAALTLSVPRSLRSYQTVKVNGTDGTLLSMAGRRGPGYALIWTKNGIVYSLTGFGDSSQAVALADSLK